MKAEDLIKTQLDPTRPVYVLIHKDRSHLYSKEKHEPLWSYETQPIELVRKILVKDFHNRNYSLTTLKEALPIIANRQAELVIEWTPAINKIRSTRSLEERFNLYKRAKQKIGPHPIEADSILKRLLNL